MQFPDDENGQILAEMVEAGFDLTKPYRVDFYAAFEFEDKAQAAAEKVASASFAGHNFEQVNVQLPEEGGGFELVASVTLTIEHQLITDIDDAFTLFVEKLRGYADGWGVEV